VRFVTRGSAGPIRFSFGDVGGRPTLTRPPTIESEVINEGEVANLSGAAALQALDDLRGRIAAEPEASLTLSWRLIRERRS
jgi:hypothetical protein